MLRAVLLASIPSAIMAGPSAGISSMELRSVTMYLTDESFATLAEDAFVLKCDYGRNGGLSAAVPGPSTC